MIYGKGYYNGTVAVDRDSHCYKQWKELMRRCYSSSYQKKKKIPQQDYCMQRMGLL